MKHPVPLWEKLNELGVPAKIWLNQGGHGDGANSGSRRQAWRDALNRFWSHYLFGVDNGAMDGPKAAVQRENGEWVDYATWPVPGTREMLIHLRPGEDNGIGELRADWAPFAPGPNPTETIVDNSLINAATLAAEAQSPHRLVYKTDPLMEPVHISGTPSVSLRLAFSEPAAVVSALLVDYRGNGSLRIVSRGWIDPQNRKSISETTPIKPGQKYKIDFDLMPHDYVFQPSSRIGLVLLSSDWEGNPPLIFTLRPPPGTEITVDTRHSTLALPVVGGAEALAAAAVR
jgi:X-Pro dipeptidyl-peptidase